MRAPSQGRRLRLLLLTRCASRGRLPYLPLTRPPQRSYMRRFALPSFMSKQAGRQKHLDMWLNKLVLLLVASFTHLQGCSEIRHAYCSTFEVRKEVQGPEYGGGGSRGLMLLLLFKETLNGRLKELESGHVPQNYLLNMIHEVAATCKLMI